MGVESTTGDPALVYLAEKLSEANAYLAAHGTLLVHLIEVLNEVAPDEMESKLVAFRLYHQEIALGSVDAQSDTHVEATRMAVQLLESGMDRGAPSDNDD